MYERKNVFSLEDFTKSYLEVKHLMFPKYLKVKDGFVIGDCKIKTSERYPVFYKDGFTCVSCGLKGKFFALEKDMAQNTENCHLNLYGIKEGKEIIFTKDHIIPKSKGGKNNISNYQCMCIHCNQDKGVKTYE